MEQDIEKSGTFFRFEDLRVYHKALDYINWVYTKASEFDHKSCQLLSNRFIDSAQNDHTKTGKSRAEPGTIRSGNQGCERKL